MSAEGLVPLLTPESDTDALTTVALLEAYGIPVHVRGGGFSALYPGSQPGSFNTKTILVPAELLDEARQLLKAVPQPSAPEGD